jgi:hypothetical protein
MKLMSAGVYGCRRLSLFALAIAATSPCATAAELGVEALAAGSAEAPGGADAGAAAAGADAGEGDVLSGAWLALLHAITAKTADKAGVIVRRGKFLIR